ncbi:MAG: hypothetical protein KIT83_02600 [Bryobacterales bacterium]|nr:hypothetical protein [Bryobacterales bacterium]
MIRAIIYLLLSIFLITIVRLVIGIVMKGLNAYLNPAGAESASTRTQATGARKAGVLRKDSLSGVYIAEDSAVVKVINGTTHYFASENNFREFMRQEGMRS